MFAQALARTVRTFADNVAIIDGDKTFTWGEFGDRFIRIAGGLRELGLKPGDRAAVLAATTPNHLAFMYAVSWAGGVLVPLNTRLAPEELNRIIVQSETTIFASDARNRQTADALLKASEGNFKTIDLEYGAAGEVSLDSLASADHIEAWAAAMSDLAALYYTGGTTGLPKGVMTSDGAILAQSLNSAADLYVTEKTNYLHAPPLFHMAAAFIAHACALSGAAQTFLPDITPDAYVQTVKDKGVTFITLVPTMLVDMLAATGVEDGFKTVEYFAYGTAPISEALLRSVMDRCPHLKFIQVYGQTECAGPATVLHPEHHALSGPMAGKLATAGIPNRTHEIKIVDPDGKKVSNGTSGEVLIRGVGVMMGYWKQPDLSAEALREGWLHTGDVGIIDNDGFLRIVDRLKDMIITGGENVFSGEVENVIAGHPDVKMCAVIGLPDERWGEGIHAVVVVDEGAALDLETLQAHCRQYIAGYKCPRSASFTADPLPMSAVGKVRKDLLRMQYSN